LINARCDSIPEESIDAKLKSGASIFKSLDAGLAFLTGWTFQADLEPQDFKNRSRYTYRVQRTPVYSKLIPTGIFSWGETNAATLIRA